MEPYLFSTVSHPETIHINPLDITFFQPKIDFSKYDYIIVTSKQAVKALDQYDYDEYSEKQMLCISQATAQSCKDLGVHVLEVGSGYGDNLSELIRTYPKETKWLYLRAKEVASRFAQVSISEGYHIEEVIVYESRCSKIMKTINFTQNVTLIFTSPSSVKCFLKYHKLKKIYRVVVIGKTTAQALPIYINPMISQEPSIKSCLKILNLL